MVRKLLLMRHAKSNWANRSLSDHERHLNDRGSLAAPKMGKHIADSNITPTVVIASTATRVRETLALMLAEWPSAPKVVFEQSLYLASAETLAKHVSGLNNAWSNVLILSHNPGMTEFVSRLANAPLGMPTAAVAVFSSNEETWADAVAAQNWELVSHWCPRDLFN